MEDVVQNEIEKFLLQNPKKPRCMLQATTTTMGKQKHEMVVTCEIVASASSQEDYAAIRDNTALAQTLKQDITTLFQDIQKKHNYINVGLKSAKLLQESYEYADYSFRCSLTKDSHEQIPSPLPWHNSVVDDIRKEKHNPVDEVLRTTISFLHMTALEERIFKQGWKFKDCGWHDKRILKSKKPSTLVNINVAFTKQEGSPTARQGADRDAMKEAIRDIAVDHNWLRLRFCRDSFLRRRRRRHPGNFQYRLTLIKDPSTVLCCLAESPRVQRKKEMTDALQSATAHLQRIVERAMQEDGWNSTSSSRSYLNASSPGEYIGAQAHFRITAAAGKGKSTTTRLAAFRRTAQDLIIKEASKHAWFQVDFEPQN